MRSVRNPDRPYPWEGALHDGHRHPIQGLRNGTECVSGFANANRDGGLLVVGIASDGSVKGLKHLNESQINRVMKLDDVLVSHGCHSKLHQVATEDGEHQEIALFLVAYAMYLLNSASSACFCFVHRHEIVCTAKGAA